MNIYMSLVAGFQPMPDEEGRGGQAEKKEEEGDQRVRLKS